MQMNHVDYILEGGNVMQVSSKRKWVTRGKILFEKIILFFLYRGMKVLYKYDTRIYEEISSWPIGRTMVLAASEKGPKLCIRKVSWGIVRVSDIEDSDIMIAFKSIDGAFLVFSGQIGTSQAYSQHRFLVKGEIAAVMSVVRCIDLTEAYLFPEIMTRRILRKIPEKQIGSIAVYCHAILGF